MYKVIKSASINIRSPKVIVFKDPEFWPHMPSGADCGEPSDAGKNLVVGETNVESVREQTVQILQETEQMVRELLETARQEAQKIIKKANEDAESIINSGHQTVRQIQEDAYDKGRKEGYQFGFKNAEEESKIKIIEAEGLVEKAWQEQRKIIEGSEQEIVQLAIAVARKVIGEEIALNPDYVVEIVKKAVQNASDRQELTVRVNPENLDITLNAEDDIIKSATGIRKLKITADPVVSMGGCVVETPNGTVDARIDRQLNEIEQALTEVSTND